MSVRACTDAAIRGLEADVAALESYRDVLEQTASDWIVEAGEFDLDDLATIEDMTTDVVDNLTTSNLGCDENQVPQVQDYIQDCLNKIRGETNRKIKNLVTDTIGAAQTLLNVSEKFLCSSLSDVISQFERYSLQRLLDSIFRDITCITSSADAAKYADQIDDMLDRIDQVLDDLPVDSSGNFDFEKLTEGLDTALVDNLDIYRTQTEQVVEQSTNNMIAQLATIGSLNPSRRY